MVRDLNLSKVQAELPAPKLKGWNLFEQRAEISTYPRQQGFHHLFFTKDDLVSCSFVDSLLNELGEPQDLNEGGLFIDSSKITLKARILKLRNHKFLLLIQSYKRFTCRRERFVAKVTMLTVFLAYLRWFKSYSTIVLSPTRIY